MNQDGIYRTIPNHQGRGPALVCTCDQREEHLWISVPIAGLKHGQGITAALDEQIRSFQEQLNAANEALRSHMAATTQTTDRVRDRIRSLCERLESTGADAATLDAQLDWDALLQLVQDVINNPNHIVYVQKLASRAADIKRVFEEYQNTRKMLDECNRLLRGLIGEGKP